MSVLAQLLMGVFAILWLVRRADFSERQELITCLIFIIGVVFGGMGR